MTVLDRKKERIIFGVQSISRFSFDLENNKYTFNKELTLKMYITNQTRFYSCLDFIALN